LGGDKNMGRKGSHRRKLLGALTGEGIPVVATGVKNSKIQFLAK